jgi:hypothetical protein
MWIVLTELLAPARIRLLTAVPAYTVQAQLRHIGQVNVPTDGTDVRVRDLQ